CGIAVHHGHGRVQDRERDRRQEGRRVELHRQAVQCADAPDQDRVGVRGGAGPGGVVSVVPDTERSEVSRDPYSAVYRKGTAYGSPEFTSEVQHICRGVLPWDAGIGSYRWTIDARLRVYIAAAPRSGRSRQLWIARHRRSL